MNYFPALGNADEVQREELQSLDAHPSVGTIKESIKVDSKFSFSFISMSQKNAEEALS